MSFELSGRHLMTLFEISSSSFEPFFQDLSLIQCLFSVPLQEGQKINTEEALAVSSFVWCVLFLLTSEFLTELFFFDFWSLDWISLRLCFIDFMIRLNMKQCQLEGQDYSSKSSIWALQNFTCTFEIKVFGGTKSILRHKKKLKHKIMTKGMIFCLNFDRK